MSVIAEIFVILPAAGCGLRMGLDKPKQYSKILNKPIICYTAEAFVSLPWVKKVVIVTAPKCITLMSEILSLISSDCNEKLMVIEGGDTRHKSICLGLKSIKAFKPQIVVIHDGVRPFVPQDILISVAAAAQDYGAAGIMCPLVSTVIAADENKFLDHALDRNKYRASEMPQAFQYSVISGAYSKCSQYDMDCGTECLHLVQKYMNKKVKLIDSGIDLWKITHKKDLYAAEGIIKEKRRVAIIDKSEASEFLQTLKDALCKRFCNVTQVEEDLEYFPLIAKVYHNDTIADIIEKENILQYPKPSTQFKAVAYITFNGIADNENFWQLQSKVRKIVEQTKRKSLAVYFITTNSGKSKELYKEVSEMASSLMFDCNINLSGQIFCL